MNATAQNLNDLKPFAQLTGNQKRIVCHLVATLYTSRGRTTAHFGEKATVEASWEPMDRLDLIALHDRGVIHFDDPLIRLTDRTREVMPRGNCNTSMLSLLEAADRAWGWANGGIEQDWKEYIRRDGTNATTVDIFDRHGNIVARSYPRLHADNRIAELDRYNPAYKPHRVG